MWYHQNMQAGTSWAGVRSSNATKNWYIYLRPRVYNHASICLFFLKYPLEILGIKYCNCQLLLQGSQWYDTAKFSWHDRNCFNWLGSLLKMHIGCRIRTWSWRLPLVIREGVLAIHNAFSGWQLGTWSFVWLLSIGKRSEKYPKATQKFYSFIFFCFLTNWKQCYCVTFVFQGLVRAYSLQLWKLYINYFFGV